MGAWSGEPFGNDTAADWAWELDETSDWEIVRDTLKQVLETGDAIDSDVASNAIAAAEVVAHGLGRPTQSDAYTESVSAFVARAPKPPSDVVELALAGLSAATSAASELSDLWAESGESNWAEANSQIQNALLG